MAYLQEHAAGAVRNLASNVNLKDKISQADGLAPLIALTRSHSVAAQESALAALLSLSFDSTVVLKLAEYGGIPPLVQLLGAPNDETQALAAGICRNLSISQVCLPKEPCKRAP